MGWKRTGRTGVIVREVAGEMLLLDTETQHIHRLNSTAHFIWSHCESARTASALAAMLMASYEVSQATALRDVEETVKKLHALQLLDCD
jgi:hypothetical protein